MWRELSQFYCTACITSAWPKGLSHSFFDCSHENILGDSLESLRVAITETHEGRKGVASRSPVSDSTSVGDEKKGERKIQLGRRQSDLHRRRRPQLQATWHCHRRRPSPRRSHGSLTPRPQSSQRGDEDDDERTRAERREDCTSKCNNVRATFELRKMYHANEFVRSWHVPHQCTL